MTVALQPGTVRWRVLAVMESHTHWSLAQLAHATELDARTVRRAIDALSGDELVARVRWAVADELYELTPSGHRRLQDGAQLQLGTA